MGELIDFEERKKKYRWINHPYIGRGWSRIPPEMERIVKAMKEAQERIENYEDKEEDEDG